MLQPAPLSASIIHHNDPFLPIDRAAEALERNIQSFLDAQSEGLLAGLGSEAQDDVSSNGTLTPTASTPTPPSAARLKIIPVRQPQKKRITLRAARRGLAKSMEEFVHLKEEELHVLSEQEWRREQAIRKIKLFEDKKAGLSNQIADIKSEEGAQLANSLKAEAENLESEIKRLEDELAEKRARHRYIMSQAIQRESSLQSTLSSFEASMKLLDSEIKKFLNQPPIQQSWQVGDNDSVVAGYFYALNPKRRTLDLAKEQWRGEEVLLRERKRDVTAELAALKEGGEVWRDTAAEIQSFETWFREALSGTQLDGPNGRSRALRRLGDLIITLERRYRQAEDNGWNILVCCIGAELEACREGKAVLSRTLGIVPENGAEGGAGTSETELIQYSGGSKDGGALHGSNESLKATLLAMDGPTDDRLPQTPHLVPGSYSRSESEDEGPGPDLLVSRD